MGGEGAVGGAVGGGRDASDPAVDGVVTGTQVAGAWSGGGGREDSFPPLSAPSQGDSRRRTSVTPAASSQRDPVKKSGLRSSSKK